MIAATIVFTIVSILGGHYIHRKRQFRLEQAISVEENPYLYKAAPGKERDLAIPMGILQLDALEELLRSNKDRKSTRLNSSHANISYAVFCLKKKNKYTNT